VFTLYLIKNASASFDNAMNSKVRIIELIKQPKSVQEANRIQASGHLQIIKYKMVQ